MSYINNSNPSSSDLSCSDSDTSTSGANSTGSANESTEGVLVDTGTGEILNEEPSMPIHSVSGLNRLVKKSLEGEFPFVWLQGEISNFTAHRSGHWYFSLKDKASQVSALMFRGMNSRVNFKPSVGMEVIVQGKITVYEPRGTYQFFCESMEPLGQGALQIQYEKLKSKLKQEGLFAPARKRALPFLPRSVAVITSPTGAAVQDIINVLRRRLPSIVITVVPAQVQGPKAPESLIKALKLVYQVKSFDVLIIGRGGGSMEDLWGFNNEQLVRTLAQAPLPVISAVGHEIDFTLTDFVADLRAPTPSAAAEIVTKHVDEINERTVGLEKRCLQSIHRILETRSLKVDYLNQRLVDPQKKLKDLKFRSKELEERLSLALHRSFKDTHYGLKLLKGRLISPTHQISAFVSKLSRLEDGLIRTINERIELNRRRLAQSGAVMDSLSPLKVLDRGYAIALVKGKIVKSIKELKKGQVLDLKLAQGQARLEVTELIS